MKPKKIIPDVLKVALAMFSLLLTASLYGQEPDLFNRVRAGDIQGVKSLIAAGADVNYEDDMMGYTALGLTGNIEMMKVLITAGANINHHDRRTGYTPLMNALNSCKTEVAEFLIAMGADIGLKSNDGATALILSCGCSEEIARKLIKMGADMHSVTDRGMGVFTQCTNVGLNRGVVSYEFAEYLLSEGADIDETNTTSYYGGYTPLFWAVQSGDDELVSFLVRHGANVNARSNKGKTPLSLASEAGYAGIIELLKEAGAR